ncbi:aspartate aminotransferase, cytoplasmic isoform X2 [Halyomorpha halys]|uniref:aspartate aminotransferase, cytoplasmic isoform X2 n=1 Tax=Halyomorpha halys TaxID=286706 RepID=UPI0006D4E370|nr:probable aspartate aminotransferase, cytoplasmic isoform X2 [Halyomorpha halys]
MPFNYVKRLRAVEEVDYDIVMAEDTDPRKIDVSHQCYRTEMGLPWVMPIVREIEKVLANNIKENIKYSSFGSNEFRHAVTEFVLGKEHVRVMSGQTFIIQLFWQRVFLNQNNIDIMITIIIHWILRNNTGMIEDLCTIPSDAVVMFYACCHNPTGCDPTVKQWKYIAEAIGMRLFPIIDLSYQGLASGDPDEDAFPVRLFARLGVEMAVCVSFSQNFLLYNDRVGALILIARYAQDIPALKGHLATMIAALHGSPPYHGAEIVTTILKNPKYYEQWRACLKKIRDQTQNARNCFVGTLKSFGVPGNWDYITRGKGMSTFTSLTDRQIQHLILYHHVYIRKNGSFNIGSLSDNNVEYVAEAIADSMKEYPDIDDIGQ